MPHAERLMVGLLAQAGVQVNGSDPWDPQIYDTRLWPRVLSQKNLGLGEAYMDGWWDCAELDEFFHRVLSADLDTKIRPGPALWPTFISAVISNRQTKRRSTRVAQQHYNLDNDLYRSFLDPHFQYSCAYFENGCSLEAAQERKLGLICDKLDLQQGDRLLDIGSGWGGLARYAASTRGAKVTGVNIATEQLAYARKWCEGLDVEFVGKDYRDMNGEFEKIVSVGMFEHVGRKNHRAFFQTCDRCLAEGGRVLLHTIGSNAPTAHCDPWIDKYIFPGGQLPTVADIGKGIEGLFVMEDWQNLAPHYAETLKHWNRNFQRAWENELCERYDERFKRMWEYYLQSARGTFLARDSQVWQVVLTRPGTPQPCCRF